MSGRGHRRRHNDRQRDPFSSRNETAVTFAADSPVLALFSKVAVKLNDRHDRHERLVKLSRDITIESKRIIFLLHSAITKEDTERVVIEAEERLNKLIAGPIRTIALELQNSPNYLHSRPISPGLQEFIEAKTLFSLLKNKELTTCTAVQKEFEFVIEGNEENGETTHVKTLLPQVDFILGIADLTGELMRRSINALSSGDTDTCNSACQTVRDLYTGFLGLWSCGHEVSKKMTTIRQNVSKVETAVYALHVRGGEAPPSLLIPTAPPQPAQMDMEAQHESDDEGFF